MVLWKLNMILDPLLFFRNYIEEADIDLIRKTTHYSQPFGDDRFRQAIEKKYGIKPGQMMRGRPEKINVWCQVVKIKFLRPLYREVVKI